MAQCYSARLLRPPVAQAIAPDDGRMDEVIRSKCESDWPNDFQMRLHCVNMQQEAARRLREGRVPAGAPIQPLIEKTEPGTAPLFEQGLFKPAGIHDGYNRSLRRDGRDYD